MDSKNCSKSAMNTIRRKTHTAVAGILAGSLIPLISTVVLGGIIVYKMYMKTRFNREPVHVYQLNFMAVHTLWISYGIMEAVHISE